jgi:hypothetical protein
MLTSERKICKLFIKFLEWDKIEKATNLITMYPNLQAPWQKAFERAAINKMDRGSKWTYEYANKLGLKIDIHFENDKLINYLILQECRYFIKWLISIEPNYPWLNKITSENILHSKKDILEILNEA